MIGPLFLLVTLATPASPDAEAWLSRLELPKLFNVSVSTSPLAFERMVPFERYGLGFPAEPAERVRDAKERLEAGEPPARLLHQAATGYAGLEESDRAWKTLMTSFQAYEAELAAEPDDFDLHMSFGLGLQMAGDWSGEPLFFEKMGEQYAAAAELEPDDARPGVHGAWAAKVRWFRANAKGEADSEWLSEGLAWAQGAVDAAPEAIGGYWWCFELGFLVLFAEHGDELIQHSAELTALVDELLEGCDEVEDGELVRFVAHIHGLMFQLASLVGDDADEELEGETREALVEAMTEHIDGLMARVEFCEESDALAHMVAMLYWTHFCMTCEDDDWDEALSRALELGVEHEVALGIALHGFHKRDLPERAAECATLLEESVETDPGRAALVAYRYETEDYAGALEAALEYEDPGPAHEVQRAVLLLRTGEEDEALELLEELAGEKAEAAGHLQHALGVARAIAGELEQAVEALEAAIDLLEDSEEAQATLDELRELLEDDGDDGTARACP